MCFPARTQARTLQRKKNNNVSVYVSARARACVYSMHVGVCVERWCAEVRGSGVAGTVGIGAGDHTGQHTAVV